MTGINAIISNNVLALLKEKGLKQTDLARAMGVSRQVMSNMLTGSRMINAVELQKMAEFFHVSMDSLMKAPTIGKDNAVPAFMGEVKSTSARKSLEIAFEMADMAIFYARMKTNAEKQDGAWEA